MDHPDRLSPCSRQGLPLQLGHPRGLWAFTFELTHLAVLELVSQTSWAHSFHHFQTPGNGIGCVVSVALSLGLLPVAVSNCLVLVLPGLSSR